MSESKTLDLTAANLVAVEGTNSNDKIEEIVMQHEITVEGDFIDIVVVGHDDLMSEAMSFFGKRYGYITAYEDMSFSEIVKSVSPNTINTIVLYRVTEGLETLPEAMAEDNDVKHWIVFSRDCEISVKNDDNTSQTWLVSDFLQYHSNIKMSVYIYKSTEDHLWLGDVFKKTRGEFLGGKTSERYEVFDMQPTDEDWLYVTNINPRYLDNSWIDRVNHDEVVFYEPQGHMKEEGCVSPMPYTVNLNQGYRNRACVWNDFVDGVYIQNFGDNVTLVVKLMSSNDPHRDLEAVLDTLDPTKKIVIVTVTPSMIGQTTTVSVYTTPLLNSCDILTTVKDAFNIVFNPVDTGSHATMNSVVFFQKSLHNIINEAYLAVKDM